MCYSIPVIAAISTSLVWRQKREPNIWWLNLMLWGGALFGVIDHLWNGELFLISENIGKDLALGCVITATIFIVWRIILVFAKKGLLQKKKIKIS